MPLTPEDIHTIENSSNFQLRNDYLAFLKTYGYGSISELILIIEPDEKYIQLNFSNHMDLWDLTESEKQALLNGLTISTTIDGDIIVLTDDQVTPFTILPRHAETIIKFASFDHILDYYISTYNLADKLYFDPNWNWDQVYLSMIQDNKLDKLVIGKIHQQFLAKFSFDKAFNLGIQPKYVIQDMGGWVYFDMVYNSAMRIKYQSQFKSIAKRFIEFVELEMQQCGG